MQAERDHLRDVVFPELESRLKERKVHLETIDLRWGVQTVDTPEQEQKELLVLKVCLEEIDRCRPFLIVLLGDRYGWIPPEKRIKAAASEKGFNLDIVGKSVTALEIEYGIFAQPQHQKRCYFYFRNLVDLVKMEDKEKFFYSDQYRIQPQATSIYARMKSWISNTTTSSQTNHSFNRLKALKARIKKEIPDRVHTYDLHLLDAAQRRKDLHAWGEQVLQDLWKDIEEETKDLSKDMDTTWQGQERQTLEEFIEQKAKGFVGREQLLEQLKALALSKKETDPRLICVQGKAGSGKSALFAKLHRELEKQDCILLSVAAGNSSRASELDALLMRWSLELARYLKPDREDPTQGAETLEEKQKVFANLLSQVAVKTRVVCLLDALNQMERSAIVRHITWLPELWPKNASFIATTIPGEESQAIAKRQETQIIDLPGMDSMEAENIIHSICQRYHKALPQEVINELLSKKRPDGTYAYSNPLWLSTTIEQLLLLDEDDFDKAEQFAGSSEQKLHALILQTAKAFPPTVEALYETVFQRAHERFGRRQGIEWIPRMLDYLAISRFGWRESDIRSLLRKEQEEDFDLQFALVKRYLRAHLLARGALQLWSFTHPQAGLVLKNGRLQDHAYYQQCHQSMATHLEGLPREDAIRQKEIMYHYVEGDEKEKALIYYSSDINGKEEHDANQVLASLITVETGEGENHCIHFLNGLFQLALKKQLPLISRRILAARINISLYDVLINNSNLHIISHLLECNIEFLQYSEKKYYHSAALSRDLSISFDNLGGIYQEFGNLHQALNYYQQSLEISEKLHQRAPDSAEDVRNLSISYERLGDLYRELGNLPQALSYYQQCLDIREELYKRAPDSAEVARNLSGLYLRFGEMDRELGNPHHALHHYQKGLKIIEELYPCSPELTHDLSIFNNKLGNIYQGLGNLEEALKFTHKSLELVLLLHQRTPDSAEVARSLSISYERLGGIHQALTQLPQALSYYQQSLDIREDLFKRAADSAVAYADLTYCYNGLGDIYQALDKTQKALSYYQKSLDICEKLHQRAPDSAEFARNLFFSCERLGKMYRKLGNLQQALSYYQKSLDISEKLHQRAPDSAGFARDLSISYESLGIIYQALGQKQKALNYQLQSLDIREDLHQGAPESTESARDLSMSYEILGKMYFALGNLKEALRFFQKKLDISK